TQTASEQLAQIYKIGACPQTSRKHKVEGSEKGDSCEKMLKKTKLETQQDMLNEENKENTAYLPPLLEQTENLASIKTKEKHNIMNTNNEKLNPWVDANSNETIVEKHDMVEETKSDNLQDGKLEGLEGLPDDCFFEHIEDMLDLSDYESYEQPTSCWDKSNMRQNLSMALRREFYRCRNSTTTNEETENTPELGRGTTPEQTNMQMDAALQEEQGKPDKMVEEKETALKEEAATIPTAEGSPTGEKNIPTIESAAPPVPMALPKEESTLMVAEPIKDELATAYRELKEQKITQSIP
ncbi:25651_t:CDS:2, partial [Gigaspora margarita]